MKKYLKNWPIIVILAVLYLSAGRLYSEWMLYSFYYRTSTPAKILCPFPAYMKNSPFNGDTPAIDKKYKKTYGSYENFVSHKDIKIMKALLAILWPIIALSAYTGAAINWLGWLSIQLLWMFISGNWLEHVGALPGR
jgi:hypothetical protein